MQPVQLYGFSKSRLYEPLGTAIFFRNRFCPVSWILVFLPVHFYGYSLFSVAPKSKVKIVAKMLKAIHAQESKKVSREKARAVVAELKAMKLKEAAKKVEDGIEKTLTYCDFPSEHWARIRTNNVIERLNREIRRRTRVVGTFPDGNSALMLVCARLRHVACTQ